MIAHTHLNQPLEGLLRPPLEWISSGISFMLASFMQVESELFFLSPLLLNITTGALAIFSAYRGFQGWRVWHYQRHLKQKPLYEMASDELPMHSEQLFLGKGFVWEAIHTQRLRNLDLPYNAPYRSNSSALGGYPHIHGVSLQENDIFMNLIDRGQHLLVLGTTGVGKTRFAELLIAQDIRRGDVVIVLDPKGDQALLKRMQTEAALAGRADDFRMIHLGFPKESCRYNPISFFTKQTQVATRITNALPSSGEAAAFKEFAWKYVNLVARGLSLLGEKPTYKIIQFYITRLHHLCITVLKNLFQQDASLKLEYTLFCQAQEALAEMKEQAQIQSKNKSLKPVIRPSETQLLLLFAEHYINQQGQKVVQADTTLQLINDLLAACRLDKTYYDKITASVGPMLEKLTSGEIANLLSPHYEDAEDHRPIVEWMDVIRQKQIVYVGLDALTDPVISSVVGNAMLSDLTATAGYLYKFGVSQGYPPTLAPETPVRINLHADEFNENIGDEFIPLLNKARGAGFNITAYTQTWSDVEARLQSIAKAGQVAGNLGNIIMFRCKEGKTVDKLIEQLPVIPILRVTPASSSSDTAQGAEGIFYQSSNADHLSYQEMPMLTQNDVLNLPKGQAFALLEGGKLFKLRLPLPVENKSQSLKSDRVST